MKTKILKFGFLSKILTYYKDGKAYLSLKS